MTTASEKNPTPITSQPRRYPMLLRVTLAALSLLLVLVSLQRIRAMASPSQFVNAYRVVESGPNTAIHLQKLPILNFQKYFYLYGPIEPADPALKNKPLFNLNTNPALPPALFTDPSATIEIMAHALPYLPRPEDTYYFNRSYHLLGWRTATNGLRVFALADSRLELLNLLLEKSENWKFTLFIQGLILAGLIFSVFLLLNMTFLYNATFGFMQLLIVNLIYLVLYIMVLLIAEYPLKSTLMLSMGIFIAVNLIFVPLALLFSRK